MNFSSEGNNVSIVLRYRETSSTVVTKNVIVVALGLTISYINGTLIRTFNKHQIFYVNPRYILFIHLVVNDIMQLTTTITLFILTYTFYKINVSLCFLLIMLAIFTTLNTPLNLAGMALECYIAICLPLRHAEFLSILPDLFIMIATESLGFFYSRIVCEKDNIFRHPLIIHKREVSYIIFLLVIWLTLLYIYFKILFAAKAAEGDAKKARNTILLHGFQLLLCMLTYIGPVLVKALLYRFPKSYLNTLFVCYIIIQILPRFLSPIVYGLRDQAFRRYLKRYLLCTVSARTNPQIALKGHT
ncbi:odorant receptor 131-2-like [Centroberyx gerrardi]